MIVCKELELELFKLAARTGCSITAPYGYHTTTYYTTLNSYFYYRSSIGGAKIESSFSFLRPFVLSRERGVQTT